MDLKDAIKERRSIRKFKQEEIPINLISEILETAKWSPSWGNTQPWEFYVLTGKPLSRLKELNCKKNIDGDVPCPDVPMPQNWPDAMKKRYTDLGKVVLSTLAIKREDKEGRDRYYHDMSSLFDAPCLVVACVHKNTSIEYAMLDIGLIAQTICLIAHDKGIGTCMMAISVKYPSLLRDIASIPEDRNIIIGIAMGYPDIDFPLNNFKRQRSELNEFVKWIS